MDIGQLPIMTLEFNDHYNEDILQFAIGGVAPKLKGSCKRKEIGEYITDIDSNSFVTFSDTLHTDIYDMLSWVTSDPSSKFIFLYMGRGWRRECVHQ